jgi:DNA-binding HxlR family transcriptional regulator
VLGGKWKLLIVAELFKCKKRYSELKRSIPEISEKMLISSLQELEYHNIVIRTVVEAIPPQVEYSLSEYGQSVRPLLETLFDWGEGHIKGYSDKIFH